MGEENGILKNEDSIYGLQTDQTTSSVAHCELPLSAASATPEASWLKPLEMPPNKRPACREFPVLESGRPTATLPHRDPELDLAMKQGQVGKPSHTLEFSVCTWTTCGPSSGNVVQAVTTFSAVLRVTGK